MSPPSFRHTMQLKTFGALSFELSMPPPMFASLRVNVQLMYVASVPSKLIAAPPWSAELP